MAWSYLPHTAEDRQAMLQAIGASKIDDLFEDVPERVRLQGDLPLPAPMAEHELASHLRQLAQKNDNLQDFTCFLGAGAYDRYIPSVVAHVLGRSEFYTAYTQYQPEFSQGYLQALWEYQSMICELTGMAVANASMYDGGTALAEAAMMAASAKGRTKILLAQTVHPHYREVFATYGRDKELVTVTAPYADGVIDLAKLEELFDQNTAALIVQYPNFLGSIEDIKTLGDLAHSHGAYLIVAADPIALGILEAPGHLGADIVVGEGQGLGLPLSFGGPYLGFFATTEKLMRKMPGRIVGQTTDTRGNRGFVLTLQAREQHIRREKATSNICSNEALCALGAAVYLSALGRAGLQQTADLCLQKAHYAYTELLKLDGCEPVFSQPFFAEFVIKVKTPPALLNQKLREKKILGGLDLGKYYPELTGCLLLAVTEKRTKSEIDSLVQEMGALL
ncbi:MAG: aminomethyl-transferring glycine dehydrogenase subunit GcvPA [Sporomusaceae bacterium]|nr:aminomethyl-transferring glycine dehydrogenase subunit GcvPA [Sporomusaceae bacterium]